MKISGAFVTLAKGGGIGSRISFGHHAMDTGGSGLGLMAKGASDTEAQNSFAYPPISGLWGQGWSEPAFLPRRQSPGANAGR